MAIILFRDVPISWVKLNEIEVSTEEGFLGFRGVGVGFHAVSMGSSQGRTYIIDLVVDSESRATVLKSSQDDLIVDRSDSGKMMAKAALKGSLDRALVDVRQLSEQRMKLFRRVTSTLHRPLYETQQLAPVKECRSNFEHFWFTSNADPRYSLITLQTVLIRAAIYREPTAVNCLYKMLKMHFGSSLADISLAPQYWPAFADWIAAVYEWKPELLSGWQGSYDSIRRLAMAFKEINVDEYGCGVRRAAEQLDQVCKKMEYNGAMDGSFEMRKNLTAGVA